MFRQRRRRRRILTIEGFEIIEDKLFVEARRTLPSNVLIGRPETRRIRRQTFVNQDQFAVYNSKFEFCVGNNNSATSGMVPALCINLQAEGSRAIGQPVA